MHRGTNSRGEMRDTSRRILGRTIFRVSKEDALIAVATAVLDRIRARSRQGVGGGARGEIRTLAAIQMRQRGGAGSCSRAIELDDLPQVVEDQRAPEPGVRCMNSWRRRLRRSCCNGLAAPPCAPDGQPAMPIHSEITEAYERCTGTPSSTRDGQGVVSPKNSGLDHQRGRNPSSESEAPKSQ